MSLSARTGLVAGKIAGEGETRRLRRVDAGADEKEGSGGARMADPGRADDAHAGVPLLEILCRT